MKKKIIVHCLFLLISTFSVSAQTKWGKGFAFKQNKKMGRGVNIIGYDPLWKDSTKAIMKDEHFELIKKAGFSNVRIVISPFKFSMNDSTYTINPNFFISLDWAVKTALKNKLIAIVDFHEHNAMQKDPIATKPKLLAMWKQIAEHCKHYPKEVLFEIANEPNMKPEVWNNIHSEAYKIIRQSNPKRTLIIGTINGNQIKHLKDLTLPEDDRNIIVAIHYYSPIQFTHQGAPWSVKNKDLSGIEWTQSDNEMQAVKLDFEIAQEWSKKYNRPLTLGEFGAYEKADMASRVKWTNYVARQAERNSWSWSYWQFDSDFILYDMKSQAWVEPIKNALIP
ncbi:endoglucanase [Arcicella rosea]|uniref:glycoside hydrolase family 5 protein n=1 Tax=Arcicella rosea TaxID=502909 RepID=UPI00345D02E5